MNLNFGENFKSLRKVKGLTQEKIAEELGVSSQSISRWELGICYPDIEMLPMIANYFGTSVDMLLSNDNLSKEREGEMFNEQFRQLSDETSECIDFTCEYCRKYPENEYYAYCLVHAIQYHILAVEADREKYMPLMLKYVQRLLETQYRVAVIEKVVTVCDEKELEKWLSLCPYNAGVSRRGALSLRAAMWGDTNKFFIQQGLQMLEELANRLDSRFPDKYGARRKAEYQKRILNIIKTFGDGNVPAGWKMYYAYKQLVLCACLFRLGETDDAWQNFREAIDACKHMHSLDEEWLDLGGELFSNLKISPDWNYAIDEDGEKHKTFAIVNYSFFDMDQISYLLNSPRWKWFNSVRETDEFKAAAEWARETAEKFAE